MTNLNYLELTMLVKHADLNGWVTVIFLSFYHCTPSMHCWSASLLPVIPTDLGKARAIQLPMSEQRVYHSGTWLCSKGADQCSLWIYIHNCTSLSHHTCLIVLKVGKGKAWIPGYAEQLKLTQFRLRELKIIFCCFCKWTFPSCLLSAKTGNSNRNCLSKCSTFHIKQKFLLQLSTLHCSISSSLETLDRIIVSAVTRRCVITCKYFCMLKIMS